MPYIDDQSTREILQTSGVLGPEQDLVAPGFAETFDAGVGRVFDEESSISTLLNREGFTNRKQLIRAKINAGSLNQEEYTSRRGEFDYNRAAIDLNDPEIKQDYELEAERSAMLARRRAYAQDVLDRGNGMAQFLGMSTAFMLDPINVATMPIAVASTAAKGMGVVGRSLLTARNAAALSAVTELGIQGFVYEHKLDIGAPNAAKDALNNIAFAAIGGGIIGGVTGGLAGYFAKVRKSAITNRGGVEPVAGRGPDAEIVARTVADEPIIEPRKSSADEDLDTSIETLERIEATINYGRELRHTPDVLLNEFDKVLTGEVKTYTEAAASTVKALKKEIEEVKDEFTLKQETEKSIKEREDQIASMLKAEAEKSARADIAAKSDDFVLSGSNRTTDVLESRGQGSIFDAPVEKAAESPLTKKVSINAPETFGDEHIVKNDRGDIVGHFTPYKNEKKKTLSVGNPLIEPGGIGYGKALYIEMAKENPGYNVISGDMSIESAAMWSSLHRRGLATRKKVKEHDNGDIEYEYELKTYDEIEKLLPAEPKPALSVVDKAIIQKQLFSPPKRIRIDPKGGQRYEFTDPKNKDMALTIDESMNDPGYHTADLELLGEASEVGGKGTSTRLYLEGLRLAQAHGNGFMSDSTLSDASHKMYRRLIEKGIPFKLKGRVFTLEADELAKIDLQPIIKNQIDTMEGKPLEPKPALSVVEGKPFAEREAEGLAEVGASNKAFAEKLTFGQGELTAGEIHYVARKLGNDEVQKGPRKEIRERALKAGLISEDGSLNVSSLTGKDRKLLRDLVVNDLPAEQKAITARYGDVEGPKQDAGLKLVDEGKPQLEKIKEPIDVKPILKDGVILKEETEATLPAIKSGFTRLYRAYSPTVTFDDVFDVKKLKGYDPKERKGEFFTDEIEYADYFRETYGSDAKIIYIDVDNRHLAGKKINPGEFVIDINDINSKIPNASKEAAEPKPALSVDEGKPQKADIAEEAEPDIGEAIKALESEIEALKKQGETISKVIAKAGGINREAALADGIDKASFNIRPLFGKPLFRKTGGKSMDEIAELLNERGFRGGQLTANDVVEIAHGLARGEDIHLDADVVGRMDYAENQLARLEQEENEAGFEALFKEIREDDIADDVNFLSQLEDRRNQMTDNYDPSYDAMPSVDIAYPSKTGNNMQSEILDQDGLKADFDRAMTAYEQIENPRTMLEDGSIISAKDVIDDMDDQLDALNGVLVCAIE